MSLEDVLSLIVARLNAYKIAYALMDGLAVRLYAIPRTTNDVDMMISIEREQLPELIRKLIDDGFEVNEAFQKGWLDTVSGMTLFKIKRYHAGRIFDVDLFIAETAFQKSLMSRRLEADSPDGRFFYATAEDLILLKLMSGRPRDMIDAHDVFFTMGSLDESYLRNWARTLGFEDRLNEAISDF